MTKYITTAVFNGTKLDLAVSGSSVNKVMSRLRRNRELRKMTAHASVFMFYTRKDNLLRDVRMN